MRRLPSEIAAFLIVPVLALGCSAETSPNPCSDEKLVHLNIVQRAGEILTVPLVFKVD